MVHGERKTEHQIIYLIAGYVVWGIFWGGWGVLLPAVKAMTGATEAEFGRALIAVATGAIPTMFGMGLLVKRFTKWALFTGLMLFAVSIASVTLASSPLTLAVTLFFVGATSGAIDVIMNSGVAMLESMTSKHYFNQAHAAFPIAVILTSPAVGLSRQFGIDYTTILFVIAGLVGIIAALSLGMNAELVVKEDSTEAQRDSKGSKMLFTKIILIFGVIVLFIHVMENAVEQWGSIYLEEHMNAAPAVASLGLTAYMAMLFVGRIVAQKLGNRWSEQKLLIVSSATAVVGFLTVAAAPNKVLAILGFAIAGFGIAPIVPIIFSLTGKNISTEKKVMAISTVTIIAYAGYMVSPPLVGYIATILSLKAAWLFLGIVGILTAVIIGSVSNMLSVTKKVEEKVSQKGEMKGV